MSAVLTAQPGLHSMTYMVRVRVKKRGRKRKRRKNTMAGGACATKPTVLLSLSSASSMHHLPSNLVSSLGLPV